MQTSAKPPLILPCEGTGELPVPAPTTTLPNPGTRWLTIGRHVLPLSGIVAGELIKAGMVYECPDEAEDGSPLHDLHVMPEGPRDEGWETDDVNRLVAILLGLGATAEI